MKDVALKAVFWIYKRILSPVLHTFGVSQCIFLPTCSEYSYVAIHKHGILRGVPMAMARIARCHPMSQGGYDPVP